jgi:hypothetical protein
MATDDDV